MYHNIDRNDESNILQGQFTVYLTVAIHNRRLMYLRSRRRRLYHEVITNDFTVLYMQPEEFDDNLFSESEALRQALKVIKEKERFVLLARIIEEKAFDEIGADLGIGYKGAAAIYYRTIANLRKLLGGDDHEF